MFEINPELEVQIRSTQDITWQEMENGDRIFNLNKVRKTLFLKTKLFKKALNRRKIERFFYRRNG